MSNNYLPLTVYLADMSYFSGKLEALLRYKELEFERREASVSVMVDEIYTHTGLMKVPVVKLANGQWLKDTTPMFDWFESEFSQYPVIPKDPVLHFLSKLVEDYADEWCWRAALYWRWYFPETRRLVAHRIGTEVLADWPIPKRLGGWYFGGRQIRTYLKGDGLTKETEPHIKQHYYHLLDAMDSLLSDQAFLLGSHPSLVDFGLFGPMFRHYGLDPAPAKVMRDQYPAVYEWLARMWNAKGSCLPESIFYGDFNHSGWQFFLRDCVQTYWPMLLQNARSWQKGAQRMDLVTPEVTYRKLKVVHYRVYCLEILQDLYRNLGEDDKLKVNAILAPYGELEIIDQLDSGLVDAHKLPLNQEHRHMNRFQKMILTMTGTPWDMPRNKH